MTLEQGEFLVGERRIAFTVKRSRRRRRTIGFVMDSPSTLVITAPVRASLTSIRSVLQKQTRWITRRLAELQRAGEAAPVPTRVYKNGESITYLGHAYRIVVTQDKDQPQGCMLRPHRMVVNFSIPSPSRGRLGRGGRSKNPTPLLQLAAPPNPSHEGEGNKAMDAISPEDIRLEILLWLKKRAKCKMQKRMDYWAGRLGVRYQKMVISNPERRWGSCSADNIIRLNWRLIFAPLSILDYVVVHELCHVRHKNHGPRFWGQVAEAVPEWRQKRKTLRLIGEGLMPF